MQCLSMAVIKKKETGKEGERKGNLATHCQLRWGYLNALVMQALISLEGCLQVSGPHFKSLTAICVVSCFILIPRVQHKPGSLYIWKSLSSGQKN